MELERPSQRVGAVEVATQDKSVGLEAELNERVVDDRPNVQLEVFTLARHQPYLVGVREVRGARARPQNREVLVVRVENLVLAGRRKKSCDHVWQPREKLQDGRKTVIVQKECCKEPKPK